MKRIILGTTLTVGLAFSAFSPADPALAHGGNGGSSSDYRVEITGFEGDASGIEFHSVEFGSRVELRRTTAKEVIVLGYSGEPYLRLDDKGAWENINSPAHYLNLDRFASTSPPASASADAPPQWQVLTTGSSVRWHDHRTHWMGSIPPVEVQANPDVERVIFAANHVEMQIDGRAVSAVVRVTWLPPPSKTPWLIAISILASLLIVGLAQSRALASAVPQLVVVGALGCLLGQGFSALRVVLAAALIVLAVVAAILRRPILSTVASVAIGVLSVTRLEVFEHQLVEGAVSALWQRVSISVALVISLATVFAQVVAWLSPKSASADGKGAISAKPASAVGDPLVDSDQT